MLITEGGRLGKIVFLLNSTAIVVTSDLPLALLALVTKDLHFSTEGVPSKVLAIAVASSNAHFAFGSRMPLSMGVQEALHGRARQ